MIKTVTIKRWKWLANKLNEIIGFCNAIRGLTTKNPASGKLVVGDKNAVLDFGLQTIELELCDGSKIRVYGEKI